jgi:alanine dehydrogenase
MLSVGIPVELKANESRVSLIPSDVKRIVDDGVPVYFQKGAGMKAGFRDYEYVEAGAFARNTIEELYDTATLIVKVKEPQESEYPLINEKHTIFTFFHFASNKGLLDRMIESKATCYAYETVVIKSIDGKIYYPILSNMSSIAGEQAFIEADLFISKRVPNHYYHIPITIIGAGNVGQASMKRAIRMGYKNINLIDNDEEKIENIKSKADNYTDTKGIVNIYKMNEDNLRLLMKKSIITIGSIYNTGAETNKLLTNDILDTMPPNSIIMDVAIDQGGITEQSRPTSKDDPLITYNNVSIYCVPNIPSCVPLRASTLLSNSIKDYVIAIAKHREYKYPELGNSKYKI